MGNGPRVAGMFAAVFGLAVFLSACATSYNSAKAPTNGGNQSAELIVGDEPLVIDAVFRAIRTQFPTENIQNLTGYEKGFLWTRQFLTRFTNFRVTIKTGTATGADGVPVNGYFYSLDIQSSGIITDGVYADDLKAAIRNTLHDTAGISIKTVAAITEVSPVQKAVAAQAKAKGCYDALADDPTLLPIKEKVALASVESQSFGMLTDETIPTEPERQAILSWGKGRDICVRELATAMDTSNYPPPIKLVRNTVASSLKFMTVDLYNGKITYAEFARKRQDLADVAAKATADIQAEIQKQNADAKARADQLALQAQQNMALIQQAANQNRIIQQNQQIINQQRIQAATPQTMRLETNCSTIGNTTQCY